MLMLSRNTGKSVIIGGNIRVTVAQVNGRQVRLGRMNIMREIADIKNNPLDAEEVFVNMITVAEGDGNISPEELKVLAEVGVQLGLRPKDFGIEA